MNKRRHLNDKNIIAEIMLERKKEISLRLCDGAFIRPLLCSHSLSAGPCRLPLGSGVEGGRPFREGGSLPISHHVPVSWPSLPLAGAAPTCTGREWPFPPLKGRGALKRDALIEGAFPDCSVVKNLLADAGDSGDMALIPGSGKSSGVGDGHPLQYSCLENSKDRGAWRAAVHGAERQTGLSD